MTAVLLALVSAALFGAMTVALRFGLRQEPNADAATLATVLVAFAVALVAAIVEAGARGADLGGTWPYLLAGLLAPGGSQVCFTLAIRDAGPSRTSVAVGAAPLVSVAIALAVLDEPVRAPLLVGAALIVAGGIALAWERVRPEHFRGIGLGFAAAAAVLFATRDNVVRGLDPSRPLAAAAATLLTGTVVAALWARRFPPLAPFLVAGMCFGLSYVSLFEAFHHGRVSVVSPLVATESLWGVGLSVLLLRRSELVGRRLVVGAALIVAGGALIGAFR
jgi:drug/metabolite transporter (DMT)-like permease